MSLAFYFGVFRGMYVCIKNAIRKITYTVNVAIFVMCAAKSSEAMHLNISR